MARGLRELAFGAAGGLVAALLVVRASDRVATTAKGGGGSRDDIAALSEQVRVMDHELTQLKAREDDIELHQGAVEASMPERTLSGDVLPAIPDPLAEPTPTPPAGAAKRAN